MSKEKKQAQAKSRKLSRELSVHPLEKYRMWKDGRKWKDTARNRMALADFLSNFGDGDGTRIYPSLKSMMRKFGWSKGKVCYLLADLREIRLLEDTPHYSGPQFHRTRVRQMNLAAFESSLTVDQLRTLFEEALAEEIQKSFDLALAEDALRTKAGVQDPPLQESKIEQESKIQEFNIESQESKIQKQESNLQKQESNIELQESNVTLDTTVTTDRHPDRHPLTGTSNNSTPPISPSLHKPQKGDSEILYTWHKQLVAIRMGRHRRIPNLNLYVGHPAQIVCDFLTRKGFAARVVTETIVEPDHVPRLDPMTRTERNARNAGLA